MVNDNKADLIRQLKSKITDDYLPDPMGGSTYNTATGTIYIGNNVNCNVSDAVLALDYFKKSAVMLSRQTGDNNALQKSIYCKIAAEAIDKILKDQGK